MSFERRRLEILSLVLHSSKYFLFVKSFLEHKLLSVELSLPVTWTFLQKLNKSLLSLRFILVFHFDNVWVV